MRELSGWLLAGVVACATGCGAGGDFATAPTPRLCTLAGCENGALYFGPIVLGGTDPLTLQAQACINGSCDTQALRQQSGSQPIFDCSGPKLRWCTLQVDVSSGGAKGSISILSAIPSGVDPLVYLQDGDTYQITIGVPGQQPLLSVGAAAGYKVSQPNGQGCQPTCKQLQLTPTT